MKNLSVKFQFQALIIVLCSACFYSAANMEGYTYEIDEQPLSLDPQKQLDAGAKDKLDEVLYHEVLDLVLVFDSSYTITTTGWYRIKKAAKQLIDTLDITPQGTHISILKFSTDVETYRIFDQNADKEKLKAEIDDMTYDGEWSRLDLAVRAIDEHVFSAGSRARLGDVSKAVVLFTDGKADGPTHPDEEVDWQNKVLEAASLLKKKDITIFAVSVGSSVDQAALKAITGSTSGSATSDFDDESTGRIFTLEEIDLLSKVLRQMSVKIPAEIVTPSPSPSNNVSPSSTAEVNTSPTTPLQTSSSLAPSSSSSSAPLETSYSLAPLSSRPPPPLETVSSLLPSRVAISSLSVPSFNLTINPSLSFNLSSINSEFINSTKLPDTVITTVMTTVVVTTTIQPTVSAPEPKITAAFLLSVNRVDKRQKRSTGPNRRWYHKFIPSFIKRWIAN